MRRFDPDPRLQNKTLRMKHLGKKLHKRVKIVSNLLGHEAREMTPRDHYPTRYYLREALKKL